MDEVKPRDMDADQRHDEFTRTYGNDGDPAVTLVELVRAAGDFLTMIVRPEDAADGMHRIIGTMAGGGEDWREALADNESGAFSEWPFGSMLHNLSAYSRYGIDLGSEEEGDETEPEDRLREMVEAAERFLALCPLDAWLGKERTPDLENTISMARARWALDHDRPVEPEGLALLGGVSQGRMRNMVTGRDPEMHRENGLIPAHEALAWLEGRDNYFPSIWRTKRLSLSREEPGHGDADMRFFFIPKHGMAPCSIPSFGGATDSRLVSKARKKDSRTLRMLSSACKECMFQAGAGRLRPVAAGGVLCKACRGSA